MSKEAEVRLGSILSTARASGGHVVLCTQRPSSDIVTPFITTNADTRICFSVPTQPNSIAVIGVGDAAGLEPAGRAMFRSGPRLNEIQSPFISDRQVDAIVAAAINKAGGVSRIEVSDKITLDDVLREAINNYGGKLGVDAMFAAFQGRITQAEIRKMITGLNGDPILISGRFYKIRRGRGAVRILVPIGDQDMATEIGIASRIKAAPRFRGLHSPHARFSVAVPVSDATGPHQG
jgi:hypothetical protein